MPSRALFPTLLVTTMIWAALPAAAASPPPPEGEAAPAAVPEGEEIPPHLLYYEEGGRLHVWASDLLQPVMGSGDECDSPGTLRTIADWNPPESARSAFPRARQVQGDLGQIVAASSGGLYDACDCTLEGVTAYASTCAPDCHSDCDEGHDGTTCHVHQYYRMGPQNYQTFIADYVDCCECSPYTTLDCGNTINTYNCGACSGGCFGGRASCCVYHLALFVRHRKMTSSNSVGPRIVRIERGTSAFASNEIAVTQGGRENCGGGSRDGWQSYSFPPDRSVSGFRVGAYLNSSWSCAAAVPSLSGSGFSCSCYQYSTPYDCSDNYCDAFTDPQNDPDCAKCSLQDGVCFPGCQSYVQDPDCLCNDPSQIICTE